jgi:hypothetical protein
MKHELKMQALLLAQAIINPHAVKEAAARHNPDECYAPPANAEVQASLAVSDLLDQAMCGMDVRWEAPLTLCAAAQFAADKHGDDVSELADFYRKEIHPDKEQASNTRAFYEAHAEAAERLSKALAVAMAQYSADIKHAESL